MEDSKKLNINMNLSTKRDINKLIIHCSDTYARMDIGAQEIKSWHQQRGWSTIGYHYVIRKDGSIEEGRNIDIPGAHCYGYNKNSIGICYVGGRSDNDKPTDDRTEAQKKTLAALCINLQAEHPNATIHGHREFSNTKSCPNFDVHEDMKDWDLYLFK
jgi:N-acetylmuramoyl-L-alanine amidase